MKKLLTAALLGVATLAMAATVSAEDYKVAMITDSGDITDQSFNQTTYESCKAFCEENGIEFNYYKPDGDSDEARIASCDQAIADGYNIVVMPGYLFGPTLVEESPVYPDVKFVALDLSEGDILGAAEEGTALEDAYNTENSYCAIYQEELSGYMAGYAAVKMGYKHLGFLGGMSVPAVIRFGYGYVQGINDAAVELGIESEVTVEYAYGNQFYGDADITAAMDTWYSTNGVEVV
ncbi:MAG: BMP family ABC transporter substrate-binding protein, partial [Blautia sp.]|nr:BMP family ABC transporter substrate-binding protein [Blautia sp.]